jgi:hypothetical protein
MVPPRARSHHTTCKEKINEYYRVYVSGYSDYSRQGSRTWTGASKAVTPHGTGQQTPMRFRQRHLPPQVDPPLAYAPSDVYLALVARACVPCTFRPSPCVSQTWQAKEVQILWVEKTKCFKYNKETVSARPGTRLEMSLYLDWQIRLPLRRRLRRCESVSVRSGGLSRRATSQEDHEVAKDPFRRSARLNQKKKRYLWVNFQ